MRHSESTPRMFKLREIPGWMISAISLCVSLSLALVASEVLLRRHGPIPPAPHPMVPEEDFGLWEEHMPYGYRLKPNASTVATFVPGVTGDVSASRELTIQSNEAGFRDRSLADVDGRKRVVVLGDSFVMGNGVPARERFTNQVESLQTDWRVINMGISGFGADLMLMAFESVGRRLDPAVVVLTLYTDDFTRVRPYYQSGGYPLPRYRLVKEKLVLGPHPTHRVWTPFGLRSCCATSGGSRKGVT